MVQSSIVKVFFGLPVAPEFIETCKHLITRQSPNISSHFHWTKAANAHITLCFIGNIALEKLAPLTEVAVLAAKGISAFSITAEKINLFPPHSSRMIAAELAVVKPIENLFNAIGQAVENLGYPRESRRFLPHITLCRKKDNKKFDFSPIILQKQEIFIKELILYQSQIIAGASIYSPLQRAYLK